MPESSKTTPDVTYTRPVVMIEAVCTCGWRQLHTMPENADFDANYHARQCHDTPALSYPEAGR